MDFSSLVGIMPVAMQTIGMLTSFAGQSQSAAAARVSAQRALVAAQFEADQLNQNAGQAIAVSQQAAKEQLRQANLVRSRAIAVAAASGAGVSDDTIMRLISRNAGEGAYRAGVALYQGEEKARQLRMAASTRLLEGAYNAESLDAKANAYDTSAIGGLISGGGSLFAKYGMGGPKATSSAGAYKAGNGDSSILDAGITSTINDGFYAGTGSGIA